MPAIIRIANLNKAYNNGHKALTDVSLDIEQGEILALLGPNGAGKTTLISIIAGIATATSGRVTVAGFDHVREYRAARAQIGLVPQEISLGMFDTVYNSLRLSQGLFGLADDDAAIDALLADLALLDKKHQQIRALSGGMKRRVLIAKALIHKPQILFLDEPTAGVDVELRKDMWRIVERLKAEGVTIILTTHYIEEAEALADRIAIINKGQIVMVRPKEELMETLGERELILEIAKPMAELPSALKSFNLTLDGAALTYRYNRHEGRIDALLAALRSEGATITNIKSHETSLEDIFVHLIHDAETA